MVEMSHFIYRNIKVFAVHGKDSFGFLQGQLTNDMRSMTETCPTQLCSLCNNSGRVVGIFFVYFINVDSFILVLPDDNVGMVFSYLYKYSVFSDVNFIPTNGYKLVFTNDLYNDRLVSVAFNHCIVKNVDLGSIFSEKNIISEEEVKMCNIYNHLPYISVHNSSKFLPSDLSLEQLNVVAFDKGCFMGQEIIARIKYLGQIRRLLKSFVLDEETVYCRDNKLYNSDNVYFADVLNFAKFFGQTHILAVLNINVLSAGFQM